MKQYKYVNVEYKMKDMVMASVSEHREIIDRYALQGYRFVGMIPTELSAKWISYLKQRIWHERVHLHMCRPVRRSRVRLRGRRTQGSFSLQALFPSAGGYRAPYCGQGGNLD